MANYMTWRRFLFAALKLCKTCGCSEWHPSGVCVICQKRRNRSLAARAYLVRNKERRRKQHALWSKKNLVYLRHKRREWVATHRDEVRESKRRSYYKNPEKQKARNRERRAKKFGVLIGAVTDRVWFAIKKKYKFRCAYCGERKPLTQDRVMPLSRGGGHTADNIVPACQSCNSSKHDKTPQEWNDRFVKAER